MYIFIFVQLICKVDLWRIIHDNVKIISSRLSRLLNLWYTLSKQAAAPTVSSQQVAVSPVYPTTAAGAVWSALHSSVEFFVKSDQTALAAGEVQCINVGDLVPWAEKSNEMCLMDSSLKYLASHQSDIKRVTVWAWCVEVLVGDFTFFHIGH